MFLEALKAAPHSDDQGATPFFESLKPEVRMSPLTLCTSQQLPILVHGFCVRRSYDELLPRFA